MNKHMKYLAAAICLSLGLLLLPSWTVSADPPSQANKGGQTYAEWAVSYWSWVLETPVVLPAGSHPLLDQGGVDCSIGQDGHVWFLGGSLSQGGTVSRSCTVPTGTAFFFPLYDLVWVNWATDPPLTPEICKAFTHDSLQALGDVTRSALLDGKPLTDKQIRFEQSSIFSVQMPTPTATETNLLAFFGLTETEFPNWVAAANCDFGWYGYVPPLSPGRHTLKWKVESSAQGLLQDVEYQLTVVPPHHR